MSAPKVTKQDRICLWVLLKDGEWHKAKDLVNKVANYECPATREILWHHFTNTRIIRAICEAEPDKFISTQKGYKRFDLASDDEITNAINDLRSRCRKMSGRADSMDKALHERQFPEQMEMVK